MCYPWAHTLNPWEACKCIDTKVNQFGLNTQDVYTMAQHLFKIWEVFRFVKIIFEIEKLEGRRLAKFQKYFCRILRWSTLLYIIIEVSGIYVNFNKTDLKIQSSISVGSDTLALFVIPIFLQNVDKLENCLNWCENLQQKYCTTAPFINAKRNSIKMYEYFVYGIPTTTIILTVFNACYSLYTGRLISALNIPAPFGSRWLFILICLIESFGVILISIVVAKFLAFIYLMQSHFSAAFKCMAQTVNCLTSNMNDKIFIGIIKEAVDLHCEIIEFQIITGNFMFYPILFFDWATYGMFLIAWMAVFLFHEAIFVAIGCVGYGVLNFMVCWTNEKLNDSYDHVKDTLYGLEWYEMTPRQRRTIWQVMVMLDCRRLLRAGPFHIMNFESFVDLLHRVYSYGLVINNVVALRAT